MNDTITQLNFLKKVLILFLLLYSSHQAYAQYTTAQQAEKKETLEVIAYPISGNPLSVVVKVDNSSPKDLITILILNSYRKVLLRENVRGRRYEKKFNFSDLPDGEYTIKVFNKRTTYVQKLGIETLYKTKSSRATTFEPLTKEF